MDSHHRLRKPGAIVGARQFGALSSGGIWNSFFGLDGMEPCDASHGRFVRDFRATHAAWAQHWLNHSAGNVGLPARFSTILGVDCFPTVSSGSVARSQRTAGL